MVSFTLVSYDKLPVVPVVGLQFLFLNMLRIFYKKLMLEILNLIRNFTVFHLQILKMKSIFFLMALGIETGV